MTEKFTHHEIRVAEQYISVLDFVSRCAQAIEEDSFRYLEDKAAQLRYAAGRLEAVLGDLGDQSPLRPGAVRAAVAHYGRFYRACRLLHPEEGR